MNELKFDCTSPAAGLMEANGWVQHAARRIWNFGFKHEIVSRMACSLPPKLHQAWKQLFDAIHQISTCSTSRLEKISNLMNESNVTQIDSDLDFPCPKLSLDEQDTEWEAESFWGLTQVDYEPTTQRRLRIRANSRAASIWGISRASLLHSLALHDLPLPLTELDAHRTLAAALTDYDPAETGRFMRLTIDDGHGGVRATLACCAVRTTYDQLGHVTQVPANALQVAVPAT
jgi:hypothetical protein